MSIRDRQLKRRNKISRNAQCPCKSGLKYKFCHGNTKHGQLCEAAVARKFLEQITTEKRTRYFKVWRLLWWLVWIIRVRRPMCPCGSGLRHMYCHGSQKKADACKEAYTSRMKVCIDEAKARRIVQQHGHECVKLLHEYMGSGDRKFENVKENSKKGQ